MSSRPYLPGDVIVKPCEAFFKFLGPEHQNTRCNSCFRRPSKPVRCLSCMRVKYCSDHCLHVDLQNGHFLECTSPCFGYLFQSWAKEDQVSLFRLYAMLKSNPTKAKEVYPTHNGSMRSFKDLKTNYDEWKMDNYVQRMCADLVRHLKNEDRSVSIDQFVKLYGIIQTNAFNVLDGDLCVGKGIYIQGSVFQHSCRPNASIAIDNGSLEIRALTFIPKGELPMISYLNLDKDMSKEERRQLLNFQYKFNCFCEECVAQPQTLSFSFDRLNILNETMSWYLSAPNQLLHQLNEIYHIHRDFVGMLEQLRMECNQKIANHCTDLADAVATVTMNSELLQVLYEEAYNRTCNAYGRNNPMCRDFFRNRPSLSSSTFNGCYYYDSGSHILTPDVHGHSLPPSLSENSLPSDGSEPPHWPPGVSENSLPSDGALWPPGVSEDSLPSDSSHWPPGVSGSHILPPRFHGP